MIDVSSLKQPALRFSRRVRFACILVVALTTLFYSGLAERAALPTAPEGEGLSLNLKRAAAQSEGLLLLSQENSIRAVALDLTTWLREPFPLTSPLPFSPDRRTRIVLFAMNLELLPGEGASTITANAEDENQRPYPLTVEHVYKMPDIESIHCLIVRLNEEMQDAGDVLVSISHHGVVSNRVRISISRIGAGVPVDTLPIPSPSPTPTPVQPGTGWQFYVAMDGRADGDGSRERPWNLATVLSRPGVVQPGNTIWLRGGIYKGSFTSNLTGTEDAPIIVRQYPGERAIIDGNGFTDSTLTVNGAWTIYRDFEVMNSNTDRTRARPTGIDVFGAHTKFISLVVHDTANGFGFWSTAVDAELYGNIIYNCGWQGPEPDRGHGHGIYTQNNTGTKLIRDNLIFNQFGWGIHAYTQSGAINNLYFEGNVSFNNGSLMRQDRNDNILVGGDKPAEHVTLVNNYTYHSPSKSSINVRLYFSAANNKDLTVRDNYFAGGNPVAVVQEWRQATMTGNVFYGLGKLVRLKLPTGVMPSAYLWNSNSYYQGGGNAFSFQGVDYNFGTWRSATGFDRDGRYFGSHPDGAKVFLRPHLYDENRTHIIVYNWNLQSVVEAEVGAVLRVGDAYEVRSVQNFHGAPVLAGKYDGKPLRLPMGGLEVAKPFGRNSAPDPTGTEFNAFVLIRR